MCSDQRSHGHRHGKKALLQALAENPNEVQSFSLGCDGGRAQAPSYPGYMPVNDSTLKELNHRTHLTVVSNTGRSRHLLGVKHTVSHGRMTLSFEPCATPPPSHAFFPPQGRYQRKNWVRNGGRPPGPVAQSPKKSEILIHLLFSGQARLRLVQPS